jgi:hypothetical protein
LENLVYFKPVMLQLGRTHFSFPQGRTMCQLPLSLPSTTRRSVIHCWCLHAPLGQAHRRSRQRLHPSLPPPIIWEPPPPRALMLSLFLSPMQSASAMVVQHCAPMMSKAVTPIFSLCPPSFRDSRSQESKSGVAELNSPHG